MTQEKATKHPWCVAVETEAEDGLTITIPVEEWEPDLANADLIVAAVNEREALLSEVAELRQALDKSARERHAVGSYHNGEFDDCTRSACAAARTVLGKER